MDATAADGATPAVTTGRRALRRRLRVAAALLPLALLVVTELGLRLADVPPRAAGVELTQVLDLRDRRYFVADPELLWAFRPDTAYDLGDSAFPPFHTNRDGLRGPEVPAEHVAAELRVLCLGDSITFGIGLTDDLTLPARIAVHLRADPRLADREIRVVNAGVPGYSSVQGVRSLRRLAHLRPDVVVWCFGMNDAKPSFGRPDAELQIAGTEPDGMPAWLAELNVVRLLVGSPGAPDAATSRVPPDDLRDVLAELRSWSADTGAEIVTVETPQRLDLVLDQFERVLAAAREAGVRQVTGPDALFSRWTPSYDPTDLDVRVDRLPDGARALVCGGRGARNVRTADIAEIEDGLRFVTTWRRRLAALEAELPESRVPRGALLHARAGARLYIDNCHLTAAGADAAGAAIARAIAARLADR